MIPEPSLGMIDDALAAGGQRIRIKSSLERWCDIELEDGTRMRLKAVVTDIVRCKDRYDDLGIPLYLMQAHVVTTLAHIPEDLIKGVAK